MTARVPPSTPPSAPDTASARGVIRDVLGGFRNLLGLVRSIRVGPQAVGRVVPDVHASCPGMARALETLLSDVPESCRAELADYVRPEAAEVERALARLVGRAMRAKDRLVLERALARATRNLEIGFRLLLLLHAVRHRRLVSVDVAELATEEEALVPASPPATRTVKLAAPPAGTAVLVDPGLTAGMLAVAAGLMPEGPVPGAFRLDVERVGSRCRLALGPGRSVTGHPFTALEAAPPTRACLHALAGELGFEVQLDGERVELVVPLATSG